MQTESLRATPRTPSGKGGARKLRRAGKLPGVVYAAGRPAMPVAVDPAELAAIFRRTGNPNTLVRLDIDGDERVCLVKELQRHPVSYELEHVDFYEVDPERPVRVTVAVRPVGTAEGIRMGGKLRVVRRTLLVECLPADIPGAIEVDVTHLRIGQFVRVSQIEAPAGVRILFENDFNVVTVVGRRGAAASAAQAEDAGAADGA